MYLSSERLGMTAPPFQRISDLIAAAAQKAPMRQALMDERRSVTWAEMDALVDRVAASLQRSGVRARDTIAICAATSIEYLLVFIGALRAGVAVAPLAPSSTGESLALMVQDCGARLLFFDGSSADACRVVEAGVPRIALEDGAAGESFSDWLAPHARSPNRYRYSPAGSSTQSIHPERQERPKESTSRTRCAGHMCSARPRSATDRTRSR
jgi:acyl-CoA synthetase (AMP-forming)/AMP-acid ligase II